MKDFKYVYTNSSRNFEKTSTNWRINTSFMPHGNRSIVGNISKTRRAWIKGSMLGHLIFYIECLKSKLVKRLKAIFKVETVDPNAKQSKLSKQ